MVYELSLVIIIIILILHFEICLHTEIAINIIKKLEWANKHAINELIKYIILFGTPNTVLIKKGGAAIWKYPKVIFNKFMVCDRETRPASFEVSMCINYVWQGIVINDTVVEKYVQKLYKMGFSVGGGKFEKSIIAYIDNNVWQKADELIQFITYPRKGEIWEFHNMFISQPKHLV